MSEVYEKQKAALKIATLKQCVRVCEQLASAHFRNLSDARLFELQLDAVRAVTLTERDSPELLSESITSEIGDSSNEN